MLSVHVSTETLPPYNAQSPLHISHQTILHYSHLSPFEMGDKCKRHARFHLLWWVHAIYSICAIEYYVTHTLWKGKYCAASVDDHDRHASFLRLKESSKWSQKHIFFYFEFSRVYLVSLPLQLSMKLITCLTALPDQRLIEQSWYTKRRRNIPPLWVVESKCYASM